MLSRRPLPPAVRHVIPAPHKMLKPLSKNRPHSRPRPENTFIDEPSFVGDPGMLPTNSTACALAANSGAAIPRTGNSVPGTGCVAGAWPARSVAHRKPPGGAQRMQGGGQDRRTDERRGQASRKERRSGRTVEYECPVEGPALHRSGLCEGRRCDDAVAGGVEPGPEGLTRARFRQRRRPLRSRVVRRFGGAGHVVPIARHHRTLRMRSMQMRSIWIRSIWIRSIWIRSIRIRSIRIRSIYWNIHLYYGPDGDQNSRANSAPCKPNRRPHAPTRSLRPAHNRVTLDDPIRPLPPRSGTPACRGVVCARGEPPRARRSNAWGRSTDGAGRAPEAR